MTVQGPRQSPAGRPEPQGSPRAEAEQGRESARRSFTAADALTLLRLPLAFVFLFASRDVWRLVTLGLAAATDLLDGFIARRIGSSRFGVFIDPVADKLFMAAAFTVVYMSGKLTIYEILGTLLRDLVAAGAFVVTWISGRAATIPARLGGKAVTLAQSLTLVAFLTDSPLLRPLAWATAAIALYAIWDYNQAAAREKRPVGQ